jgi:hypothetical protein
MMRAALFTTAFLCVNLYADISLDSSMTAEQQQSTGVSTLSPEQKKALESWLNANFEPKKIKAAGSLSLSENIENGKQLRLSNGALYEIAPQDRVHTALWITPFPITIEKSGDPSYPDKLINGYSQTSVKAKLVEQPSS